jgi:hypothetical protein
MRVVKSSDSKPFPQNTTLSSVSCVPNIEDKVWTLIARGVQLIRSAATGTCFQYTLNEYTAMNAMMIARASGARAGGPCRGRGTCPRTCSVGPSRGRHRLASAGEGPAHSRARLPSPSRSARAAIATAVIAGRSIESPAARRSWKAPPPAHPRAASRAA